MCPNSEDDAAPPPLFEILHEDADPSASAWIKLRRFISPFGDIAAEVVSYGYAAGARRVLEQKERVEDALAARRRSVTGDARRHD